MKCTPVTTPEGGGFLCGPRRAGPQRCSVCGKPGGLLCDGQPPEERRTAGRPWLRRRTCDRPLCPRCTTRRLTAQGPRDYCPSCATTHVLAE